MPKKKKSEPEVPKEIVYGNAYAEIYYKTGDVPYSNGKKYAIKLLSPRVGQIHNGIKVVLSEEKKGETKWRIPYESERPRK